jgi:hypothetical protein
MLVIKFTGTTDTVCTLLDRTPIAPSNLTVTQATATGIQLSWGEVTNIYGDVQYNMYISEDNGSTYQLVSTSTTATATASGLTPLTSYLFQVTTLYDNGLESDFSSVITGTTTAVNTIPTAPANLLSSSISNNSAVLTWDASVYEDGSFANYIVFISGDNETFSTYSTVSTTTVNITGLPSETTYFFKISAVDNQNAQSEQSEALSVTTTQ